MKTVLNQNIQNNKINYKLLSIIFIIVAFGGLFYVKWNPYYHKAFLAASKHSIGNSIISGKVASAPKPSWAAAWGYTVTYFTAVWKAVVLGLLLGSLIQVLIPKNAVKKLFGRRDAATTAAAGAAALPGMMCSCCAAPVAVGLRKSSASVESALAFFLANPVLNPATIIFMGFVLSWKFAIYRLVIGIILVMGVSILAGRLAKGGEALKVADLETKEDEEAYGNLFVRWIKAFLQLIIDTIPVYVIAVTLLGAARAWLFPVIGAQWANSILAIVGLAIAGTLFVIPTAAEIPVIQTLMSFGLGAGPAAALLITLPAVSLPSLLLLRRAFPAKILVFVGAAVAVIGIVSGLLGMFIL